MKYATFCKFCKNPITIEIDDSYAELGDPYKIIPLAGCNPCADIRVEKRSIENKIKATVLVYSRSSKKSRERMADSVRDILTAYTKKYSNMIARWHHKDGMAWDIECVNLLMEKPNQWNVIIGELWKMYSDWEKHSEQQAVVAD